MTSIIVIDVKPKPSPNNKDDYDVIRHICAIPAIRNMLDVLCVSSKTRWAVECALVDIATKNARVDIFFSHTGGMKDYMTDVKFIHRPLLVLTKVNNEQRSRTSSSWPHANDTLSLPTCTITFSNEGPCHPERNHYHPFYVSVEHHNKVVCHALVDPGASTNLLLVHILY